MNNKYNIPFLKPPLVDIEDTIQTVNKVLRTNSLSSGHHVEMFEKEFAKYIGTKYAISCNSGTSALELVLAGLKDIGELDNEDKVIIPSFTYVGVANAVINAGLRPVFCDIGPDFNLNINETLHDHIDSLSAIIPVHTFGLPCDMDQINEFAEDYGLIVIEDCAEACGAEYKNKKVGSIGRAGIFSFTPTKIMTTGEGGMITTDDDNLASSIHLISNNGLAICENNQPTRNSILPGHNYRMSNITASIGRVQLKHIDQTIDSRIQKANTLITKLKPLSEKIQLPEPQQDKKHVYQLFTIQLNKSYQTGLRDRLYHHLCGCGIEAKVYFNPPIHRQSYYNNHLWVQFLTSIPDMPQTVNASNTVLSLPMYPSISDQDIENTANEVSEVVQQWCL